MNVYSHMNDEEFLELVAKNLIQSIFMNKKFTKIMQLEYTLIMAEDNEKLKDLINSILKNRGLIPND